MTILPQLTQNKGTVSSALGKSLAKAVLEGQDEILYEAVTLVEHPSKNVRAGAAKIIEQVALQAPEKIVPLLDKLTPALTVPEPQTRWMVIHTFGCCAALAPEQAEKVFPQAEQFMAADSGACLWGATILYLGAFGALSTEKARLAFPLLDQACQSHPNLSTQILKAILLILPVADGNTHSKIIRSVQALTDLPSASTARLARKILKSAETN